MDSNKKEPRSVVGDARSGEAYEPLTGRWSRLVAPQFLEWLDVQEQGRWLDIGCGTGALIQAILDSERPQEVVGVDPSADFIAFARREIGDDRVRYEVGDARDLPVASSQYDGVVSGLVLNALPVTGLRQAVAESVRAARRGGRVGAYVWDYAEGMEPRARFWEAATEVDGDALILDERSRYPMCQPDELMRIYQRGGLNAVQVREIVVEARFENFDDYWQPHLLGIGVPGRYVAAMPAEKRDALRQRLQETLPGHSDGSITLPTRAWVVKGVK